MRNDSQKPRFNNKNRNSGNNNARPPIRRARPNPDNARFAAARLIWLVLEEKRTLDDVMLSEESFSQLDGRDRGFAAAISKETLRYLGVIDNLIAQKLQKPLPETAFFVRALLRTAVAQYLAELAPIHAIIDRAVELAKFDKISFGMSGLINAILRKIFADNPKVTDNLELLPNPWAIRYKAAYGEDIARDIAGALLHQAPIDLTLRNNLNADELKLLEDEIQGEKIGIDTIRIKSLPENFTQLESYKNGFYWVQDAAASLPAQILKPQKGEEVLDMCAAPGGKTMQLASMGGKITAIDLSDERMKIVAQNLARTMLHAKLLSGDAKKVIGENEYDAILLDAPCSATGTIRRNLESLWIKNPYELPKLMEIQCELIRAAYKALKPNGRLVFAICSMEKEEADMAVSAAQEAGFRIDPIASSEVLGLENAIEERGTARILPFMLKEKGGLDGFFIARFIK